MGKEYDDKFPLRIGVSLKKLINRDTGEDNKDEKKKKLKKLLKKDPGLEDKSIRSKDQRRSSFLKLMDKLQPKEN